MGQSVYFNGKTISIPGVYSATDVSMMGTKGDNTGAKVIAFIGECTGGEPGAVQFFNEPTAARKVLKSGDLLKACEKAWNPVSKTKEGVKLGGANMIACIRSNKATKSTYSVKKQDAEKAQLVFHSKDYGDDTAHQIKIQDGSLNSTKKVVIYDQSNGTYETYDNIGNVFTINYTGEEAYAELNIYVDGSDAMYFQTKVGADKDTAVEDIRIKLDKNVFKTMKALIAQLQSYENYVVSASNTYNTRLKVTDLDLVTAGEIKLDSGDTAFRVTAVYSDLQFKLANVSQLVELVEFDKSQGAIENFDYVTLTDGTRGVSPASWLEYFDALSNFDIFYIVPLTSGVSIHAELASHINTLSASGMGRERRGVVGGENGETVVETLGRARDLASDRIQVVHGGLWDYNTSSELELYPPYILAAQHAGRAAFLEDGEAATHDVYRMSAPEYKLERTEIAQLLEGGCLAFEFVLGKNSTSQSYVRLVQDLTTDTTSADTVHTERATGALADSINKEIREKLDDLITGKRTGVGDLTSAKNRVISVLSDRKRKGHIVDYKDVYVTKTGTVTTVDYSVAPSEVNNFTLITAHYYSETIVAE